MKKNHCGLGLIFILFFLAACSHKSDYVQAIPKGATAVVAVDMQSIASKSGLAGKEGEAIVAKLTQLLRSGLEGESYKIAEDIMQDPAQSGLSLNDKLYLFSVPDGSAQLALAKVANRKKLENLFEALAKSRICSPLLEEEGCSFTQMGDLICVFNDSAFFLLYSPAGHAENFKRTLFLWLRQEEGEGFSSTAEFKSLMDAKGDVIAVVNMALMPRNVTTSLRMGMPANLKLEDLKFLLGLSFEQGRTVLTCQSITTEVAWQSIFNQIDTFTSPMNGSLLELLPGNTLFAVGGNVKGGNAYELLCQNPTIRKFITNPMFDVESVFRAIEGDFVLGYSSLETEEYLGYAQVSDTKFLRTIESLRPLLELTGGRVQLNTLGTDQYEFRKNNISTWFGVKNGLLYITNNKTWAEESGRRYGASLKNLPWSTQSSQNRIFSALNINELKNQTKGSNYLDRQLGSSLKMFFDLFVKPCDYVTTMSSHATEMTFELSLDEKSKNALQLLLHNLETFIN
ncbi:MAG: DUF4836 family protein [Phocaeicola sp.]